MRCLILAGGDDRRDFRAEMDNGKHGVRPVLGGQSPDCGGQIRRALDLRLFPMNSACRI